MTRSVERAAAFWLPSARFHRWLASQEKGAFLVPLEKAGPTLAISLDDALGANKQWSSDSERHSKSLRLVELLYSSVASFAGQGASDALRDGWSAARHEDLVVALGALVGQGVRYTSADRVNWLLAQSSARRSVRLLAMGVTRDLSTRFESLRTYLPHHQAGRAVIVIGPFGSGKSELAEEWHIRSIEMLRDRAESPVPLWLHASELSAQSLESFVGNLLSPGQAAKGVALTIDGLDEIESAAASRLVGQARAFVVANNASSVLATSRPGVLSPQEDDVHFDGLESEEAVRLVEDVSGKAEDTWSWNPILMDAIRRPFFAIAAGQLISEGRGFKGQAELIVSLVERALGTNSSATVATRSTEVFRLMVKASIASTRTGTLTDGLNFQERQVVRQTTLMKLRADGVAEFSLPIFQQWFAGTAILEDPGLVDEALSSSTSFDRWRWALAVAATSASTAALDGLFERCVRLNPGAGSWLLERVADGHRWFGETADPLDAATAAERLLRASRAWIDATRPLSRLTMPWTAGRPIGLGVRVDNNRLSVGWLRRPPASDSVAALPESLHVLASDETWWIDRQGAVAEGDEWPWVLARTRTRDSVLKILEEEQLLGPERGVWHGESMYRAARLLAGSHTMYFSPLSVPDLKKRAGEILAHAGGGPGVVSFSGREVPIQIIADLVRWLDDLGTPELRRPYPTPDVEPGTAQSSWIWAMYTDPRLQEFYAEIFGAAVVAYEELVDLLFPTFGWSLALEAERPVSVIADIRFHPDGWGGERTPGVTSAIVPLATLESASEKATGPLIRSSNGRAIVSLSQDSARNESWVGDYIRSMRETRSGLAFSRAGTYSDAIADDVGDSRPASKIAARWLFNDLKDLGLAEGTFPQLGR